MTVLGTAVEITKAAISSTNANSIYLLNDEENRKKFLAGLEALYKKLDELHAYRPKP